MASLSDQLDRFTRNTRNIKAAASQTAHGPTFLNPFTRAVLDTHLGDLIRDIDPSELGLFSLVQPSSNAYDQGSKFSADPQIKRSEFPGATPLRRRQARPENNKQEVEPEVYAHAALKYVEHEPVRPMSRAYDQIISVLNRLNTVRENIEKLNNTLKQTTNSAEAPPTKTLVEQEEHRIQELQARIAELSRKKENVSKTQRSRLTRPNVQSAETIKEHRKIPKSPSSPQEAKFWSTPGDPSRTLRFSDNLLDEEVNLGDVSTASFGSPIVTPAELRQQKTFAEMDPFAEEPTVTHFLPLEDPGDVLMKHEQLESESKPVTTPTESSRATSPDILPTSPLKDEKPVDASSADTPGTRQRRIKVNIEVERIVSKIWSTIGDIIPPPKGVQSPSVGETIAHLQQLAAQTPQAESPLPSSASSASLEGNSPPSVQQVFTAYLLTMLLSTPPHYSMSLNQVKENLALKAKTSGVSVTGQGTNRILYGCVAKRLVKIDRGGREQVVKFDI